MICFIPRLTCLNNFCMWRVKCVIYIRITRNKITLFFECLINYHTYSLCITIFINSLFRQKWWPAAAAIHRMPRPQRWRLTCNWPASPPESLRSPERRRRPEIQPSRSGNRKRRWWGSRRRSPDPDPWRNLCNESLSIPKSFRRQLSRPISVPTSKNWFFESAFKLFLSIWVFDEYATIRWCGYRCYVRLDILRQLESKKRTSTSMKSCDLWLGFSSTWKQQLSKIKLVEEKKEKDWVRLMLTSTKAFFLLKLKLSLTS